MVLEAAMQHRHRGKRMVQVAQPRLTVGPLPLVPGEYVPKYRADVAPGFRAEPPVIWRILFGAVSKRAAHGNER